MSRGFRCPNCNAPCQVDPKQPVVTCGYCGTQSKNTLYRPPAPKPQQPAQQQYHHQPAHVPQRSARVIWLVVIATVLPGIAGLFITLSVRSGGNTTSFISTVKRTVSKATSAMSKRPAAATSGLAMAVDGESGEDSALGEKMAAYDYCLRRHSPRSHDSRRRYLSWVADKKTGPTCRERYISYGLYTLYDPDTCIKAAKWAADQAPKIPELDGPGGRYAAALPPLVKVSKEADRYYDRKTYETDDCVRGQALHTKLMAGWDKLFAAERELREAIEARAEGLLKRRVDKARASNDALGLHVNQVQLRARRLTRILEAEDESKTPDLEGMRAALGDFRQAVDALEDELDARRGQSGGWAWMGRLKRSAVELLKAAQSYVGRRAKGRRLSRFERRRIRSGAGWMVDGSLAKVQRASRRLVDAAATVHR